MKRYVIVCRGHGVTNVMPSTIERAMLVFKDHQNYAAIDPLIIQYANDTQHVKILTSWVAKAMLDIASLSEGVASNNMRQLLYGNAPKLTDSRDPLYIAAPDARPIAIITKEQKIEVALWLMKNNQTAKDLRGLTGDAIIKSGISMMRWLDPLHARLSDHYGKPALFVDGEEYLEWAATYRNIVEGRWKVNAKPHMVANEILQFVNTHMTHRDVEYEVVEIRE